MIIIFDQCNSKYKLSLTIKQFFDVTYFIHSHTVYFFISFKMEKGNLYDISRLANVKYTLRY